MADTICSAILTPLAVNTYCVGHVDNVHVRPRYDKIKEQFAGEVRKLQHRYKEASGRDRGGLIVSDAIGHRPGGLLFR
jgi:hypothetical protein